MILSGKYIKSFTKYLTNIKENEIIVIGRKIDEVKDLQLLKKIGFTEKLEVGERILPSFFGSKTKFNSEGFYRPLKNLPKEIFYIYSWIKPYGKHSEKIVTIPKKRYQREFISGPEIEINIGINNNGEKYIYIDPIVYNDSNSEMILLSINIFLEIFGSCEVLDKNLISIIPNKVKRLSWKILPPGINPWEYLKSMIDSNIYNKKPCQLMVYKDRVEKLAALNLEIIAEGKGGQTGYFILKPINKKVYILENFNYGNATYIFGSNYEELSKITKNEILNNNLQIARIIHSPSWENNLKSYL